MSDTPTDPAAELAREVRRVLANPDIGNDLTGEIIANELLNVFSPGECHAIEKALADVRKHEQRAKRARG